MTRSLPRLPASRRSARYFLFLVGPALFAIVCWAAANQAEAQFDDSLGLGVSSSAGPSDQSPTVEVQAEIIPQRGSVPPKLRVTANIAEGWHIYSTTQASGGPLPTKIKIDPVKGVEISGAFQAEPKPAVTMEPEVWPGLSIETHEGKVTWTAPLEISQDVDFASLEISGFVEAQACNDSGCLPPERFDFVARPVAATNMAIGSYRAPNTHAEIRGSVQPAAVAPGSTLTIELTAEPSVGYHVYGLADRDPQGVSKPTLIVTQLPDGWTAQRPVADTPPREKPSDIEPDGVVRFYEGAVTWTVEIQVPDDAAAGEYPVSGIIGYQTCYEGGCDRMTAARFEASVRVAGAADESRVPLVFTPAEYTEAARLAEQQPVSEAPPAEQATPSEIAFILGAALLGGFILNFMPCVLPVIGLKILGFVEQSQHDRGRVLVLNLWYVLGLLSVFAVLAVLAVWLQMGWGEQFTSETFNIVLICLVFAMALSFLGVWEIPIPGFVGSGKANEIAAKEGALGAFSKGMLTTVLATPCSGPFLGPVFGFTLTQSAWLVFAIFGCVGIGMASPYLVIGAFPRLIRFLPKPGAWMDTFKHLMGFVLLGTVVFLFTFVGPDVFVPTLAVLVAIWFGCWWIGRRPVTASLQQRLLGWGEAIAVPAAVALLAFGQVIPNHELSWQPYSPTELQRLVTGGHTVIVDFTANWCLTCKTNERVAINTAEVKQLVEEYDVVPMVADWTDGSPEIKQKLNELGSNSIPLLAVFPAGRPGEPIVLRDLITKQQVLDALREAGRSKADEPAEQTAMRGF